RGAPASDSSLRAVSGLDTKDTREHQPKALPSALQYVSPPLRTRSSRPHRVCARGSIDCQGHGRDRAARMSRRSNIALVAAVAATGAALRRRGKRIPTDPFDPDAIRAENAAVRTAELVARPRVRRADLAQTFAPAISTAVEPL